MAEGPEFVSLLSTADIDPDIDDLPPPAPQIGTYGATQSYMKSADEG